MNGDIVLTAAWKSCWEELRNIIDAAEDGAVISLEWDCLADSNAAALSVPAGKAVTLDLNGHTLNRSRTAAAANGNVITVNGALTLVDSVGGGAVTGGWNSGSGGGIVNNGTLTVQGGEITGNRAAEAGAIYNAAGATFSLEGGVLTGNSAFTYGGGAVLNRGAMIMTDGSISGNTAKMNGGAVWTAGAFTLSGGSIRDNAAGGGQNGGGIFFSAGTLELSGAPEVWENSPNNLYLNNGTTLTAAGALGSGLKLGIACATWPTTAEPGTVMTGVTDYAGNVVSDKAGYLIHVTPDGEMRMIVMPTYDMPDFALPASLTEVDEEAFAGIVATVVYVPDGCGTLGNRAFKDCASLTQIRIPADCALGEDVFDGCGTVFVFAPASSPAEMYCRSNRNCVFVEQAQE